VPEIGRSSVAASHAGGRRPAIKLTTKRTIKDDKQNPGDLRDCSGDPVLGAHK
jgi:hypothetical protein